MTWRLAVDIGGTFTDVVALEEASGRLHLAKVRSTPDDPAQGFVNGLEHITQHGKIDAHEVNAVFHGTTVATNAILERKYSELGLNHYRRLSGSPGVCPPDRSRRIWRYYLVD